MKQGRKRFSAAKLIGPERSAGGNLLLAGIGGISLDPREMAMFTLVADWPRWASYRCDKCPPDLAPAMWQRGREFLLRRLLEALDPALTKLDPGPIYQLATAIEIVRTVNESGALSPLHRKVIVAALDCGQLADEHSEDPVPKLPTRREYAKRFGLDPRDRSVRRILEALGIRDRFTKAKAGRPRKMRRTS